MTDFRCVGYNNGKGWGFGRGYSRGNNYGDGFGYGYSYWQGISSSYGNGFRTCQFNTLGKGLNCA